MRGAAALLAAILLAGCDASQDVPPDRRPRFEPIVTDRPGVALVLGSGGPRGFAHIGVLKVLEEEGIQPDLVVGSSVGAMVGALHAAGLDAAGLEREAHDLSLLEVLDLRMLRGGPGSGTGIQRWVNERVGWRTIEALGKPLVVAATRVSDGAQVLFNRGDTGLAVRASSASPGQFEPVRIGGDTYVDGDESSPVPIRAARQFGARVVIAVDVSAHAGSTPSGVPREWVEKDARRARQVAAEAPAADVLLHPDIGYYAGHSEEYRRRVIALAERYTRARLPEIRSAIARGAAPPQPGSTARSPAGVASR